jgi:hypothetical protein
MRGVQRRAEHTRKNHRSLVVTVWCTVVLLSAVLLERVTEIAWTPVAMSKVGAWSIPIAGGLLLGHAHAIRALAALFSSQRHGDSLS